MVLPWGRGQGNSKRQQQQQDGPVDVTSSYAQSPQELELFSAAGGSVGGLAPLSRLGLAELLAAFPDGAVPREPFDLKGLRWQLRTERLPQGGRPVHLAVLLDAGAPQPRPRTCSPHHLCGGSAADAGDCASCSPPAKQRSKSMTAQDRALAHQQQLLQMFGQQQQQRHGSDQLGGGGGDLADGELLLQQLRRQVAAAAAAAAAGGAPYGASDGTHHHPYGSGGGGAAAQQQHHLDLHHHHHHQQQQQQQESHHAAEHERRKFTRNLLSANNKKESLERYKAIMSLTEACRRRLAALLPPGCASPAAAAPGLPWAAEPAASLLQAVLDVGEALASFGNSHFPEHSNEARAILAGDYRQLLRQYLGHFGFLFAGALRETLPHDMQEEVQSVGSLLATRCEAYDLLYDQLVRHVGLEGRGGPSTLVLNHNSAAASPTTTITANPTNTTNATAVSRSKASVKGLGGAAIAAAGVAALLLVRAMRGGGGGGRRGGGGGKGGGGRGGAADGGAAQPARPLRIPKGKSGREMLLVSQLSACGDELRRARRNDELLIDDWRLGRHVRLAWPPGPPVPPGYEPVAPDACNVTQLLQELYS